MQLSYLIIPLIQLGSSHLVGRSLSRYLHLPIHGMHACFVKIFWSMMSCSLEDTLSSSPSMPVYQTAFSCRMRVGSRAARRSSLLFFKSSGIWSITKSRVTDLRQILQNAESSNWECLIAKRAADCSKGVFLSNSTAVLNLQHLDHRRRLREKSGQEYPSGQFQ